MDLVSVIIPTYNCEEFVAHALDSVFAQTYPHIEVIVVDDGSVDETVRVARARLEQGSPHPWQLLEHGSNGGPSAARNTGLRAARGAWIQFLDSDDLLAPTKCERQMAMGRIAPPEVAAVHSPWQLGNVRPGHTDWEGRFCNPNIEGQPPIMCLVARVRPLLGAALIRRSVLEQVRGFDEGLRFWECEELCFRIAQVGRFAPAPSDAPLYLWRMPPGKEYIGHGAAKYQSTSVGMSWIEQILNATGNKPLHTLQLPKQDREHLLDECAQWARDLYGADRELFAKYMVKLRALEPTFRPRRPRRLSFASGLISYERAEALAELIRELKQGVRRVLRTLALVATPALWDVATAVMV